MCILPHKKVHFKRDYKEEEEELRGCWKLLKEGKRVKNYSTISSPGAREIDDVIN
jgi:hypothetical protein